MSYSHWLNHINVYAFLLSVPSEMISKRKLKQIKSNDFVQIVSVNHNLCIVHFLMIFFLMMIFRSIKQRILHALQKTYILYLCHNLLCLVHYRQGSFDGCSSYVTE